MSDTFDEVTRLNEALKMRHPQIVMLLVLYVLGTKFHELPLNPMYEEEFAGSLDALRGFGGQQLIVIAADTLLALVAQHQIDRDGFIALPLEKPPAELMEMIFGKPDAEA